MSDSEVTAPFGSPDVLWDKHSDSLPEGAFVCGESEGKSVYAGRVRFGNELLIGTVNTSDRVCVFSVDDVVHTSCDYEIMATPYGEPLVWEAIEENGPTPNRRNLLKAGRRKDKKALYVGRIIHDNKTSVGWVELDKRQIHVAVDGSEKVCANFEILVHSYLDRLCVCPPCPPDYCPREQYN